MFSALEDFLFKLFNMTLRADFLDWFLPLFESSLPVFLVALISVLVFAGYCKKTYGEFFYRFLLFMGMIVLSAIFAKQAAKTVYIERPRPYQEIAGTMFYDDQEKTWMQAQYAVDELYPPVPLEKNDQGIIEENNQNTHLEDNSFSQNNNENNVSNESDTNDEQKQEEISLDEVLENSSSVQNSDETVETTQEEFPSTSVIKKNTFVIHGQAKLQPSSVIAISMAIAFVIALLMAKTMPYIYLFPLVIGWSQIYTGNAYLSDLIVGWVLGMISVVLAWLCFAFFFKYAARLNH